MKRVLVVGSSCAGKTTLAKRLQGILQVERIELDAINWLPDWQERDYEEFTAMVDAKTADGHWVVDGNYNNRFGRMLLDRADTVIWLNLPFLTVYRRLFMRTFQRVWKQEILWNGNQENFLEHFFSTRCVDLLDSSYVLEEPTALSEVLRSRK